VEASTQTIGEFLEELFPGRDITAGLKRVQGVVETLADRIPAVIERVVIPACETLERLDKLPITPGYEPMLIGRGQHPLIARCISHGIIRLGKDEAKKAKRIVVDAFRFLAKPGRTKRSISRRAAALLEVWNTTSHLGNAFSAVDISVFEFVEALEGAVRGDLGAFQRVTEVAAALAPGLSIRRGRKASAVSIAHELLLIFVANTAGSKSYTYDPVSGDFTDPMTRATRLAFGNPGFDPRPAFRRQRARRRQKSNWGRRSASARGSKQPQLVPLVQKGRIADNPRSQPDSRRTAMGAASISSSPKVRLELADLPRMEWAPIANIRPNPKKSEDSFEKANPPDRRQHPEVWLLEPADRRR
jgi:hypothetical protein